jgi:hypothetical protein
MMDLKMGFGVAGELSCFPNYLSLSLFCRYINSKTQKHSATSKTKSRSVQLLKRVFSSRKVESLQWVLKGSESRGKLILIWLKFKTQEAPIATLLKYQQ